MRRQPSTVILVCNTVGTFLQRALQPNECCPHPVHLSRTDYFVMARVAAGGLILQVVIWGFGFIEKSKNLELLSRMAMEKTVSSSVLYLSGSCKVQILPMLPIQIFFTPEGRISPFVLWASWGLKPFPLL